MDSNNIVIQEEQLEEFISHAEMVIEESYDIEEEPNDDSDTELLSRNTIMANAKVQISDMLTNKTFVPKNMAELGRLFDIFVFADMESQFLSILENCEANVLAYNPEEAKENRLDIGFMKAHTKDFSQQALQDIVTIIESEPLEKQDPHAWYYL